MSPSPADTRPTSEAGPWVAFAACSAIWGSTFLVISIGNDALAPVWAATLRLALAALLLGGVTLARRQALPRGAALRAALGYGVAQFGVNLPLLYWGEKVVPSGLSAVVYATIPLSSALITRAFRMERLTPAKVAGAVVAFGRRRGAVLVDVARARGAAGAWRRSSWARRRPASGPSCSSAGRGRIRSAPTRSGARSAR